MSAEPKPTHGHEEIPRVDVSERGGRNPEGETLSLDQRLFFQLSVYECAGNADPSAVVASLGAALKSEGVAAVVYADANAPRNLGVLVYDTDPTVFVKGARRAVLNAGSLSQNHDFSMMGRSYASGHETDLPFWLIERPKSVVENPDWNWAVWYPLRRNGDFAKLEPREQAAILREHAIIGRAYGAQDLAHDVRLACHGLDAHDNEFVVGLIGKDLHPLSHVVQAMRKTRQTSEFIVQMGPFFVGHVCFRTKA
jgi:hypothetical protein